MKCLIFIRQKIVQDINKLQGFGGVFLCVCRLFFFFSERGPLKSKQTASTRKVYVTALIKIPAKKKKNTLDLTRARKLFLREHMDKMLRLLQEKTWNKYACAEEGKYVLNKNLELRKKVARTALANWPPPSHGLGNTLMALVQTINGPDSPPLLTASGAVSLWLLHGTEKEKISQISVELKQ